MSTWKLWEGIKMHFGVLVILPKEGDKPWEKRVDDLMAPHQEWWNDATEECGIDAEPMEIKE